MRIDVITVFPELISVLAGYGVTGRAIATGRVCLTTWNPRDFTSDVHRTVDDRPYGGGPGMVMKVEPLRQAICQARAKAYADGASDVLTVYLSPQGQRLDQASVCRLAARPALILIAGRYEGVDERLIELEVDEEWSIGDYVLSGGELPALVLIDAMVRLQPGVLGDADSAQADSFMQGLLDHPHYTRPASVAGLGVPQVLLMGDHEAIRRWRLKQALGRTLTRRPELLATRGLSLEERELLTATADPRELADLPTNELKIEDMS